METGYNNYCVYAPDTFVFESKNSFREKCVLNINNEEKVKKPKKKKAKKLKKASSKVGVLEPQKTNKDKDGSGPPPPSPSDSSPSPPDSLPTHKPPLLYCRFIAKYPLWAFFLASSFHVAVIVATVSLMLTGYDVFPIEFEEMPLLLNHDQTRTQDLAWRDRDMFSYRIWRPLNEDDEYASYNSLVADLVEVILEVPNYDVYSQANLNLIRAAEERLFNMRHYQDTYCFVSRGIVCEKPTSVIRLFDGTFNSTSPIFYDPTFSNIRDVLCASTTYSETMDYIKFFLEDGLDLCDGALKSSKTRFFIKIGWPIIGGNNKERIKQFVVSQVKTELESIRDVMLSGKMSLYYISKVLFDHDVVLQAWNDMKLTIGSFLFIFCFMWIQTASFWITFMGIFSILTSFLLTNIVYRFILGYEYFGFFHIISMFIILGIGADDVFIFYDTWRLTGHTKYPSKAHRLSDCYRTAAKTTFVTSLTTATAFFVSGLSPLLPVCTFGIFSGILVLVNYLCDLLYFPTVIMVYSEKIKPFWDECFHMCKSRCTKRMDAHAESEPELLKNEVPVDISRPRYEAGEKAPSSYFTSERSKSTDSICKEINTTPRKEKKNFEDRNRIVLFLKNGFYDFMSLRVVRVVLPTLFVSVSAFFIWSASKLEPDSQHLQIFRESHNYGRASRLHHYSFQGNFEAEYTSVYLTWGILRKDLSTCNLKSSAYCTGQPRFDDTFDPNPPEAQIAMKNLCHRLETMGADEANSLRIKRNAITDKLEIACFTTSYETFLQRSIHSVGPGLNLELPLGNANVRAFMDTQPSIYYPSDTLPDNFDEHLGIGLSYWLTNQYSGNATDDYYLYNGIIGEQWVRGTSVQARNAYDMYYATKLKYIAIQINTTLNVYKLGYPEGMPVYERWEELMNQELRKMPDTMKNGFQCTKNTWHWLKVQESLSTSAVQGVIIGLCLALPLLILTTLNVVIGFLATVVIGLVTACVIGIIPLAGWKLGVLESLNMCMVVGLSVDYVVHLAEAYATCPSPYRNDRVRSMLESMGLSVLSGAVTTFGAACFMLFSQIQFIYQFGIFVMSTISISFLFSFFAFTTFMSICGPQGNTGNLRTLGKWLKRNCCYCSGGMRSSSGLSSGRHNQSCLIACVLCHCSPVDDIVLDSLVPIQVTRQTKRSRGRTKHSS